MKKYGRNALRLVSFALVLVILLLGVSAVVQPKGNRAADGEQDPIANGILGEPKNTIDVLFLGDSEAYHSVIPLKIWKDTGITSYVCATPAQRIYYSLEFLKKTLKTQKPKLVIFETNALFSHTSYLDGAEMFFEERLTVFRYHNRWKTLSLHDFSFGTDVTGTELNKGYRFSNAVAPAVNTDYMTKAASPAAISSQNKMYAEKMKRMCDEGGAKLVFLSTPSAKNWNKNRHAAVQKFAEELSVEYTDLNIDNKVNIDWQTDTKDQGDHLNHNGALKVTSFLDTFLADSGLFTDKRTDSAYEKWNDDAEQFVKGTGNSL